MRERPVDPQHLGRWTAAHSADVTQESIERYADAIGERSPYCFGREAIAPPLFGFVCAWSSFVSCANALVREDLFWRSLHLAQDSTLVRPIRSGERLVARTRSLNIEPRGFGTGVVLHSLVEDAAGILRSDMLATLYIPERDIGEPVGAPIPKAPTIQVQREAVFVTNRPTEPDLPRRYAQASGDHNPVHVNEQAAADEGFPGLILQGMCTAAVAISSALDELCDGDPGRIRRVACRFSRPVVVGEPIETKYWVADTTKSSQVYGFRSRTPTGAVLKGGVLEIGNASRLA